jgi:hypothetical protein
MANFNFTVDTSPMAETVNSVKGHVSGVTAAVTAMEAAVIATERQASKTICENIDNGFYVLVKSQISQKAVAAYTEMTAKEMTLLQLGKALDSVRRQMEADYNMISARYAKLFTSLDKALETRVRELDRPAMRLAEIKKSVILGKLKDSCSALLCASADVCQFAEMALAGKLKHKVKAVMETLSGEVKQGETYSRKIESILLDETAGNDQNNEHYLPVVLTTMESAVQRDEFVDSVFVVEDERLANSAAVVSAVNNAEGGFADLARKWNDVAEREKQTLRGEVLSLIEKESLDSRVANEVLRLFDDGNWQVLQGG